MIFLLQKSKIEFFVKMIIHHSFFFSTEPAVYKIADDGYSYKMHTGKKTWQEAEDICKQEGGHLAMVKTQATHDYVTKTWNNDFWIGVNDISQEGNYQFVDGSPVMTAFWAPRQPDNHENKEDCIHYMPIKQKWNDNRCNVKKSFLCQIGGRSYMYVL